MKTLLVGSGAREHALARTLAKDPSLVALHALPSNPGIGSVASTAGMPTTLHHGNPLDAPSVTLLAQKPGVDLAVIGRRRRRSWGSAMPRELRSSHSSVAMLRPSACTALR